MACLGKWCANNLTIMFSSISMIKLQAVFFISSDRTFFLRNGAIKSDLFDNGPFFISKRGACVKIFFDGEV